MAAIKKLHGGQAEVFYCGARELNQSARSIVGSRPPDLLGAFSQQYTSPRMIEASLDSRCPDPNGLE